MHFAVMFLRTALIVLPLACLPWSARGQANWQSPAISAAQPAGPAASKAAASSPALAPAASAAGGAAGTAASAPAAAKKPASASELASKIVQRLEQAKTELPPPKARPQLRNGAQAGASASSFLTPAELRAKLAAQAAPGTPAPAAASVAPPAPPKPRAKPAPRLQPAAFKPHVPGQPPHWTYAGGEGPEHWAALSPEFARCASGTRQSPIDIRDGIRLDLEVPVFEYQPSRFSVLDNGHTIEVKPLSPNFLNLTGRRYELVQLHFHHPAEERVNGRGYDMVVHLVHKSPDGRLAVVAALVERGATSHEPVQMVWNNLPLEKNESVTPSTLLDFAQFLPERREYYTYMGSLTTPPCTEGVLWVVMKQPIRLSDQQVRIFARLYPMNARPVQLAGDRLIKESN